jgi:hypothetical protein
LEISLQYRLEWKVEDDHTMLGKESSLWKCEMWYYTNTQPIINNNITSLAIDEQNIDGIAQHSG